MVLKVNRGVVDWKEPTKPVRMLKNCVAAKAPRKTGEIVEVGKDEHFFLVTSGHAEECEREEVKDLGEPVVSKRSTRKKKGGE